MKAYNIVKTLVVLGFLFLAMPQLKAQTDFFIYNPEDFYINRDFVTITSGFTVEPFGAGAPLGSGLLIMSLAGAGYVALKRKRSSKKGAALMFALVMLLGLTQCRKPVETIENTTTTGVRIKLIVDDGDRHGVNPENGDVYFTDNDRILVTDGNDLIGYLIRHDGVFQGNIDPLQDGDEMHFYFLSNKDVYAGGVLGIMSIHDQTDRLPTMAYGHTTYHQDVTEYSCQLHNKCALIKFKLQRATNEQVQVGYLYTEVQCDLSHPGEFTARGQYYIDLYSASSSEKWAVVMPQAKIDAADVVIADKHYTVSIPATHENDYITDGIRILNAHTTFKIAPDHEVYFSPGNLQYNGSTHEWRFAEHQYDSPYNYDTTTWVDMFAWARWCPDEDPLNMSFPGAFAFTGQFEETLLGHNDWCTLTANEWNYLLFQRPDASQKVAWGGVGGMWGVVLVPELWETPDGCSFDPGLEEPSFYNDNNDYDYDEWALMESAGAVFLPMAGSYDGGSGKIRYSQEGYYWSSSEGGGPYAHTAKGVHITHRNAEMDENIPRFNGVSVRLVRTAPMSK